MVKIRLDGGELVVTFPYSYERVERVKSLPERRAHKVGDKWSWLVPLHLRDELVALFPEAEMDDVVMALEVSAVTPLNYRAYIPTCPVCCEPIAVAARVTNVLGDLGPEFWGELGNREMICKVGAWFHFTVGDEHRLAFLKGASRNGGS